jgi:hypothetical protein
MAKALKDYFDARIVRELAAAIRAVFPGFDAAGFTAAGVRDLMALELTERGRHVSLALERFLPPRFAEAAAVLGASLGPELATTDSFGLGPLRYLPHVFWIARCGLAAEDFEAAMMFQEQVTKRFSAEYSIRAFLEAHPRETYARLERWAGDPNVHLRRLVSEGTRPRLPWAPRLPPSSGIRRRCSRCSSG